VVLRKLILVFKPKIKLTKYDRICLKIYYNLIKNHTIVKRKKNIIKSLISIVKMIKFDALILLHLNYTIKVIKNMYS